MDYEKEYLKYRIKYYNLKNLVKSELIMNNIDIHRSGGGKKGKKEHEDSDLITHIKADKTEFNVETLSRLLYDTYQGQLETLDENGNLPIQIYLSFGGNSESTIDYLLPVSTLYLHKNNDGDGILNIAAKVKNNEDLVEYLWFSGLNVSKNVRNKSGYHALDLSKKLAEKEPDFYKEQVKMLTQLYDDRLEPLLHTMYLERREKSKLFEDEPKIKVEKAVVIPEAQIPSKESKISKKSVAELIKDYNKDSSMNKELLVYSLKTLNEVIDFGLTLETVYVDKSSLDRLPDSEQILEIKVIDFTTPQLSQVLSTMDGIIGVIVDYDREAYEAFLMA